MLTIVLAAIAGGVLRRASGGWDIGGWTPPWGSMYRKLWCLLMGGIAASATVWWLVFPLGLLAWYSRMEQTKAYETSYTIRGASIMGLIGCVQWAVPLAAVAWWRLDPDLLLWLPAGMACGAIYWASWRLPANGAPKTLLDFHTAWAELGWGALLAGMAAALI
ncbi:hypothetical protein [Azospirillum sp.]|uniref:hypothetical protein n=1 Tax=Azospirillum sp. TaxID=34012 RepID=UPI003D716B67